ncbi:MAG: RES domain-containing protein [Desulfobacterales bacterium]|nr:MAG: RES domain-containing protein [Desulfobacterales bacterium]
MAIAWRIAQAHVADRAFTGEGARRYGGRWNSKGVAVVYTSSSISLAILEVLVHIPNYDVLEEYVGFPVEFSRDFVVTLDPDELPRNWSRDPSPQTVKQIGDIWVESQESVILEVPSTIVPTEKNYLINPAHPDLRKLKLGSPTKFEFDPRLVK